MTRITKMKGTRHSSNTHKSTFQLQQQQQQQQQQSNFKGGDVSLMAVAVPSIGEVAAAVREASNSSALAIQTTQTTSSNDIKEDKGHNDNDQTSLTRLTEEEGGASAAAPADGKKKKRIRHREPPAEVATAAASTATSNAIPNANSNPNEQGLTKQERETLKRRSRQQKGKERKMECFLCRQKGHSISNCPRNSSAAPSSSSSSLIKDTTLMDYIASEASSSLCYRCGSLEHNLSKCLQKVDHKNPLPYSSCFICKQKGHLAGQCPENLKGVYPNGGSCKFCGSVRHLAKDCKPCKDIERNAGGVEDVQLGMADYNEEKRIRLGSLVGGGGGRGGVKGQGEDRPKVSRAGADDDDQFTALFRIEKEKEHTNAAIEAKLGMPVKRINDATLNAAVVASQKKVKVVKF